MDDDEYGYDDYRDYNDDENGTFALLDEVTRQERVNQAIEDAAAIEEFELRNGNTSASSRDTSITLNFATDNSPPQNPVTTSSTSTNANNPAENVRQRRATFLNNIENQKKRLASVPEDEEEIVATPANKRQCLQDTPHPQHTSNTNVSRTSDRKNKGKRKDRDDDDSETSKKSKKK